MFKNLTHDIALMIQARSGVTAGVVVWLVIIGVASVTAFAFLCVAGYQWFAVQVGDVFAGLIMTGIFVVIALIAALISAMARRRARERAILARAARAHAPSWLLDPRLVGAAVQAGRTFGWQRILPVVLLGFVAAQWARDYRSQGRGEAE